MKLITWFYQITYLGSTLFTFDGTTSTRVSLSSQFQCVQGNNPRSISFDIQTTITTSTVIIWTGTTASYGAFAIDLNFGSAKGIIQVDGYTGAYTPTTGRIVNDGQ